MTIAEQALVVHAYCTVGESGAGWRAPAERLWASFAELGEVTELVAGTPARVPAALAPGDDFTCWPPVRSTGPASTRPSSTANTTWSG